MYEVTSATVDLTKTVRPHGADVNRFPDDKAVALNRTKAAEDDDFAVCDGSLTVMSSPQKLTFY
jgi:hypothetical protein